MLFSSINTFFYLFDCHSVCRDYYYYYFYYYYYYYCSDRLPSRWGGPAFMTLILLSAPALSRPISWPAAGATASESGPPTVLPILLRVDPPDPSNIASRSDFRLCSLVIAYMSLIDRAPVPLSLFRGGGGAFRRRQLDMDENPISYTGCPRQPYPLQWVSEGTLSLQ